MKTPSGLLLHACIALIFGFFTFPNTALSQSAPALAKAVNKPSILHVSRSSTVVLDEGRVMKIWGTIDGSKVELMAIYAVGKTWVVAPGDYPVEITFDEKTDHGIVRDYEVELTPGHQQSFFLAGLGE